jgi:hypothetical protein
MREKIPFDDLVSELRALAPGRIQTVCMGDLHLLRAAGALDWSLAGSLTFQYYIGDFGRPAEKLRLVSMGVGFHWAGFRSSKEGALFCWL